MGRKQTITYTDDITGAEVKEDELQPFEFVHPVTEVIYLLETTRESYDNFVKEISGQQAALDKATSEADAAYEAAVAKAAEAREKALEKARTGMYKVIDKVAPDNGEWQPKRVAGRVIKAGGSTGGGGGGNKVLKARNAFINSPEALELAGGNKSIKAAIINRRSKASGRLATDLEDWLNLPEILAEWHPDHKPARDASGTPAMV